MTDADVLFRLSELERKLSYLYAHAGVAEPGLDQTAFAPEVIEAVRAGNPIQAIKLHRERTGLDLAAAKAAIDTLTGRGF